MRYHDTMLATVTRLSMIGFAIVTPASAAPPTSTAKPVEDAPAEIPAVPYLTLALARDPSVHKDLGLKPRQIDKVQEAIAQVDEQFWQLRDIPVKKCAAQLDLLYSKLMSGLKRELTPTQFDRFQQIVLQGRSWKALVSAEVAGTLKLSAEQLTKVQSALKESLKEREVAEKESAGKSSGSQEQTRARLRTAETKRFMEILTTKQQADYRNQLGQPFDFSRVTQVGCVAPELRDVTAWINSQPLTLEKLRGKVVVVHFWAFGCINCIRNLPHYQGWHEKFAGQGVTIIGIQTPETESERQLDKLQRNVIERRIEYPVVFDAASENWKAWGNNMWPSVYLIDKQGRVRNWWYGELNWEGAKGEEYFRKRIEELLAEK
ncbi:MAG: redoxin domain-containing protein [Planctomycetes bacterium]|nr:redoxin domain-containing protein [Planctomycetota bacterium]